MKLTHKKIGDQAEKLAQDYLKQNGLKLLHQNFHSRFGEIDLIMQDLDSIVFIEVKKRKTSLDNALESITKSKQNKLVLTAKYYLSKLKKIPNCRFDVVAIDGQDSVLWLKNVIIL